ncbi:MAG: MerR family DNA-binding transcriptional regulator, partial [Candidatus Bathyarchaeia archaeon]
MIEKLLTLSEACKRLGVHPNTLRKWDRQGKVRVVRTVG